MSQVIHSAGGACRDCGEAVGNVHRWSCGRYRVGEVAGRLVEAVECGPLMANAIVGVEPLRSAAADDAVEAVAADPAALDAPLGGHTASDHAALLERFYVCPRCGAQEYTFHEGECVKRDAAKASEFVFNPSRAHTGAPLGPFDAEVDRFNELREQARLAAKHRLAPYLDGPMKAASAAMALVDEPRVKACVACKWSKVMAGSKGLLCHYNPPGPAGFPPVLATDWCREFSVGGGE